MIEEGHFGLSLEALAQRMAALPPPDEIWTSSIMTYWYPSSRDVIALAKRLFPKATTLVGGIYPTLAPDHAREHIPAADIIFKGEVQAASQLPTDLSLYAT